MITQSTVCLNCGKQLRFHCLKFWHFLQCCPGTCPAEPDSTNHFYPPQPKVPERIYK